MTESDLKEVLTNNLENELDKILKSGCVELSKYEDDFILPKIVFSAMLKDGSFQFAPTGKEYQKEIRNVYNFL